MLEAPRAVAVTVTGPLFPGMQAVKSVSQCPAQAMPFAERLRMEVSLEEKVTGVAMFVPEVVWTVALKVRTPPKTREVLLAGVIEICPGKMGEPALEPPHPVMLPRKQRIIEKRNQFERNRPMPPLYFPPAACRVFANADNTSNELENL